MFCLSRRGELIGWIHLQSLLLNDFKRLRPLFLREMQIYESRLSPNWPRIGCCYFHKNIVFSQNAHKKNFNPNDYYKNRCKKIINLKFSRLQLNSPSILHLLFFMIFSVSSSTDEAAAAVKAGTKRLVKISSVFPRDLITQKVSVKVIVSLTENR